MRWKWKWWICVILWSRLDMCNNYHEHSGSWRAQFGSFYTIHNSKGYQPHHRVRWASRKVKELFPMLNSLTALVWQNFGYPFNYIWTRALWWTLCSMTIHGCPLWLILWSILHLKWIDGDLLMKIKPILPY